MCGTRGCGPRTAGDHPPNTKAAHPTRIAHTTSAGRRAGKHCAEHD